MVTMAPGELCPECGWKHADPPEPKKPDPAIAERAAVVAWLRERADHCQRRAEVQRRAHQRVSETAFLAEASGCRFAADAIERGEHEKEPTP
jgi:hypothetical protein